MVEEQSDWGDGVLELHRLITAPSKQKGGGAAMPGTSGQTDSDATIEPKKGNA